MGGRIGIIPSCEVPIKGCDYGVLLSFLNISPSNENEMENHVQYI